MKRVFFCLLIMLCLFFAFPAAEGESETPRHLTLMIYMCGTNLESQYGSASDDILEMLEAGADTSQVSIMLMTGGSRSWELGMDPESITISEIIRSGQLRTLVSDTPMNMGSPETLSYFIDYCMTSRPAEQYALLLWDHGAGPLGGICMDELNGYDRLSMPELTQALTDALHGEKLSWIGFDACLMSTAEVACAVAPFARYMVASQETEPAAGWNYAFLKGLEQDGDGADTGCRIVDAYFTGANEGQRGLTLSCLRLEWAEQVASALTDFFAPLGREMDEDLFIKLSSLRSSSTDFGEVVRSLGNGYDLVDLGNLIDNCSDLGNTIPLSSALSTAVLYSRASEEGASGLSVYHPLHNKKEYTEQWKDGYSDLEFSPGYQRYLNAFGTLLTGGTLADWTQIRLLDDGFGPARENLFSMQLQPDQLLNFASAQLIVMGSVNSYSDSYELQLSGTGAPERGSSSFYPVWTSEGTPDADGKLSFAYTGRSLYLTDDHGQAIAGPIGYRLSDDGRQYYIVMEFSDLSGVEKPAPDARVLFTCEPDEQGNLNIVNTEVYDSVSGTFTRRIAFRQEDYTDMSVDRLARRLPEGGKTLPGMEDWKETYYDSIEISLPLSWHLRFFDEQLSGVPLFATVQITDVQQNSYCTPLIRVENPNLMDIGLTPRKSESVDYDLTVYAVMDTSQISPGLSIGLEVTNRSLLPTTYDFDHFIINGTRTVHSDQSTDPYIYNLGPGETGYTVCHIPLSALSAIPEITLLTFETEAVPNLDYSNAFTRTFQAELTGGVTGLDQSSGFPVLARWEKEGLSFELLQLEKNHRSGLTGLLHIVNDTDEAYLRYGNAVLNGLIQTEDQLRLEAEAHTDTYCRFELNNRALLSYFMDVKGTENRQYLGVYHLFEQYGIQSIERLSLVLSLSSHHETVVFEPASPIPFDTGEQSYAALTRDDAHLLLDDDIQVWVHQLLVGSNGVGMILTLHNQTDRDLSFEICHQQVNGHSMLLGGRDSFGLGAHASLVTSTFIAVSSDDKNIPVSDISLAFRYNDFTSARAHIRPHAPADLGVSGGIYLSPDAFDIEPVSHGVSGSIQVSPDPLETAGSTLALDLAVSNRSDYYMAPEDFTFDTTKIHLNFRIQNLSEQVRRYRLTRFIINDIRMVSGLSFTMDVQPGEEAEDEMELTLRELANLEEIFSVSATLDVENRSDPSSEHQFFPVRWELSGCSIAGNVPHYDDTLAENTHDGLTFRLVSMYTDTDGSIDGVIHVRNDSEETKVQDSAEILMNDVWTLGYVYFSNSFLDKEILPHTERYVPFSYSNSAQLTFRGIQLYGKDYRESLYPGTALQSLGIHSVQTMTLLLDSNKYKGTLGTALPLRLRTPFVPEEAPEAHAANLQQAVTLLDGEVSLSASILMSADNGVIFSCMLRNDTDDYQVFTLTEPCLGSVPVMFSQYSEKEICGLAPHSRSLTTLSVIYPEGTEIPEIMGPLSCHMSIGGTDAGTFTLYADLPLVPGSGTVMDAPHLRTESADTSFLPEAAACFALVNTQTGALTEYEHAPDASVVPGENEVFAIALKLRNPFSQDLSPQVSALIRGRFYTWPLYSIRAGSAFYYYCIDAYEGSGLYDCVIFADGQELFRGSIY